MYTIQVDDARVGSLEPSWEDERDVVKGFLRGSDLLASRQVEGEGNGQGLGLIDERHNLESRWPGWSPYIARVGLHELGRKDSR